MRNLTDFTNNFKLLFVTLFLMLSLSTQYVKAGVYAQLSSNTDQLATPDTVNEPTPIEAQTIDEIEGMEWDKKHSKLMIKEDGVYFIMAVLQVGAREITENIVKGGDIYYWVNRNNAPVADTGSWVFASPLSRSKTISGQWAMALKKDDELQFMFSSSAPYMGLLSLPSENNRPASPGLTVTVFKIDSGSKNYAQLVSDRNQLVTEETINQPEITLMQKVDSISGMDWNKNENKLTIKENGLYFINTGLQIGTKELMHVAEKGGDVYFWYELNGKKIANSGNWIHVSPSSKSNYIIGQFATYLKADDVLCCLFTSTAKDIGLVTFRGTELRPASPGISMTIFKI